MGYDETDKADNSTDRYGGPRDERSDEQQQDPLPVDVHAGSRSNLLSQREGVERSGAREQVSEPEQDWAGSERDVLPACLLYTSRCV